MCFSCLLKRTPSRIPRRIAKGYGSTGNGLSSEAISWDSLHTRFRQMSSCMGEKSLQQCSSVYFCLRPFRETGVQFRSGGLKFCFMQDYFLFIPFLFLTKCTLTFQCAATLGEERMQASLLGDNGETYHWKAQKPLVKSSACLCECECNSCAAVDSYSTFVLPSWVVLQRFYVVQSNDTLCSHKFISTIDHFYKKSIYFKVFAS